MSIYNQTGVKISQYQTAQVDSTIRPNKLSLEHFLISYAPSYYGTSTINKNFKVPVNLLRNDFIGYVGIKNAKSDWRNTIKLWCGDWSSSDLPNSYICTWTKEDIEKYSDFIAQLVARFGEARLKKMLSLMQDFVKTVEILKAVEK